jgi:hypothetical protein
MRPFMSLYFTGSDFSQKVVAAHMTPDGSRFVVYSELQAHIYVWSGSGVT